MQGDKLYNSALIENQKENPNINLVLDLLNKAIQAGNYKASYALGTWYLHGVNVKKDVSTAFNLIETAANARMPKACFDIAICYETGTGVKENKKKAFSYYLIAAKEGDKEALYEVGRCYYYGIGVKRNVKIGKIWINEETLESIEEEMDSIKFSDKLNRLFREKKWKEAKKLLKIRHAKFPDKYYLITELSQIYYCLEEFEKSLIYAEQAMQIESDDVLVIYNYGCALSGVYQENKAIEQWNKILEKDIKEIAYGNYGEGLKWAKSIVNDSLYRKALSLIELGCKNEALELINKHLKNRKRGIYSDFSRQQVMKKQIIYLV